MVSAQQEVLTQQVVAEVIHKRHCGQELPLGRAVPPLSLAYSLGGIRIDLLLSILYLTQDSADTSPAPDSLQCVPDIE